MLLKAMYSQPEDVFAQRITALAQDARLELAQTIQSELAGEVSDERGQALADLLSWLPGELADEQTAEGQA